MQISILLYRNRCCRNSVLVFLDIISFPILINRKIYMIKRMNGREKTSMKIVYLDALFAMINTIWIPELFYWYLKAAISMNNLWFYYQQQLIKITGPVTVVEQMKAETKRLCRQYGVFQGDAEDAWFFKTAYLALRWQPDEEKSFLCRFLWRTTYRQDERRTEVYYQAHLPA